MRGPGDIEDRRQISRLAAQLIGFDEAVDHVRAIARPFERESVAIAEAAGRVLADPIVAKIDSPRADVSAMDGYAVRDADLGTLPARLSIAGRSFAGAGWTGPIRAGECARVFTGAPVPQGADRIIVQENVDRDGEVAIIAQPPGKARHIRERGSDFAAGEQLLPAGRHLDARAVVAAAAADMAEIRVWRRPRVGLLSTGDELAAPGSAASAADAIPESVSFGIAALAAQWGAVNTFRRRLPDDLRLMKAVASDAVDACDLVVVTGGASVGEKDFAKAMFEPHGLELRFSKVAIKPGKPVWLGHCGGVVVFGVPGNPTSAMVTARLLLAPLIAGLCGRPTGDALHWRRVPLASPLPEAGPRETFHRARLRSGAAEILSFQDSSAQKALAQADLLVRQRADGSARDEGAMVDVLDF